MSIEVDNEGVGGVEGGYGGVDGRLLSVTGQFIQEAQDPSTEGDIKKRGACSSQGNYIITFLVDW